ncbi:MAG: type II secretion system protein GspE [Candidatus Omnitrophica bacterium CG07_land_8_20_14_0_80_42_15]|uniref:Type II secretion system protein GspE n=1 Tax=Candidatus Aquitaenariimonas noxiae TaxID=1974741 RepID=A0A2J0KUD4_9BACT|nr:MAG: type II secretion system protein GspE [Candidatus Omnitrophica bacterium CG07_land_8_20_14_0_80_42_15]
MGIKKNISLGEMLVDSKLIATDQLKEAIQEQKKTHESLDKILLKLGFLTEEKLMPVLAKYLNVKYTKIKELKIDPSVIKRVSAKFACHYKLMPIKEKGNTLIVAVTDPTDIHTLDDLKLLLSCDIEPVLAGEIDILEAIRTYYGVGADTIEKMIAESGGASEEMRFSLQETKDIGELTEDASMINFVNQILFQAYNDRATDIHIEPYEDELIVRYRIDGLLYDMTIPHAIKHFQSAIVSRIKIMANLNIAERRLPQDGRIKIKVKNEELDLRVSVLPTAHGEGVDIRILPTKMLFDLEGLGFLPQDLKLIESMIKKPHGIIFVTGPTGSGKTTTLYACLNRINTKEKKIITIEDPIEYRMKGITQIQVQPKIGLDFATGLRSMLRHDPDIMMVGEVRDYETVEITIRAALTGHLVFSTIHTNDAPGAMTRLLDMSVEPFLAASSINAVVAQRLVRIICKKCKKEIKLEKSVKKELGIPIEKSKGKKFYAGKGCEYCKFTGYKGRTAIYEIMLLTKPIEELVLKKSSADQIRKKAISLGMRTLRMDGWEKILMGITTPEEVIRVTKE